KKLVGLAISKGAEMVIFPELSITGYEPTLSETLATDPNANGFDDFQKISDEKNITMGIGAPTKNGNGVCISLLLFRANKPREIYSKRYLHQDEEPFFVRGQNSSVLINDKPRVAIAICYELSVPQHSEDAFKN